MSGFEDVCSETEALKRNRFRINLAMSSFSQYPVSPIISNHLRQRIIYRTSVDDEEFDLIYPLKIRALSMVQWSSITVAMHVADFLADYEGDKFLDIGSGPGKLCTLLALLTDLEIFGVEQRLDLVKVAESVAIRNNLKNLRYYHGNMMDLDWNKFDVFYLYNPFQEHICDTDFGIIDKKIELDRKYYFRYLEEVLDRIIKLQPGKRLITYHGYGGHIPFSMRLIRSRVVGNGQLCMWEKMTTEEIEKHISNVALVSLTPAL